MPGVAVRFANARTHPGRTHHLLDHRSCKALLARSKLGRVDKRDSHVPLNAIQAGICNGDQLGPRPDVGRAMGVLGAFHHGRPRPERAQTHQPPPCSRWNFLDRPDRCRIARPSRRVQQLVERSSAVSTLAGLWEQMMDALNESGAVPHALQMIDSTVVRAHHQAAGVNVWPAPLQAKIG